MSRPQRVPKPRRSWTPIDPPEEPEEEYEPLPPLPPYNNKDTDLEGLKPL